MSTLSLADASMRRILSLPALADVVTSSAVKISNGANGNLVAECEVQINAPAVTTGMLADDDTITYEIIDSANADLSSPRSLGAVITQTGSGGAGAPAIEARCGVPSDVRGWIGLRITKSGAGDASLVSASMEALF